MKSRIILMYLLICAAFGANASVPVLEREISLSFTNEKIGTVLARIQEQAGVVFSYQPSLLNGIGPVTAQLKKKTVREALASVLPKTIVYKPKNNYIILKERPAEKASDKKEISGYVIDKTTERKVANVTIYDKQTLQSTTTDEYGFYTIKVPSSNEKISVNKESYKDTILATANIGNTEMVNISLKPEADSVSHRDSLNWRDRLQEFNIYTRDVVKKFKGFVNTLNIKDTISRNFQVSLFPFVGTNHKLSGNVVNKVSLNIYGGYARGVDGFEAGGLFNIDEKNVKGVQLAGLFNIVGDSVQGTQCADLFNIVGKSFKGFQAAGLFNVVDGSFSGVQLAGLMNFNERISGTSAAVMMNISGSVKGAQLAALSNINDTLQGAAVAGMFNVTKNARNSVQVASLFNVAESGSSAVQVAALFNRGSYIKGVQVGLLNFSDSARGIPVGLFSFVKKGVHQVELSADELFSANLSFRTGVPLFHNIFSVGLEPGSGLWQLGYGVGTSVHIKNKWHTEANLMIHHLSSGRFYSATSDLYRIYCGVEYRFKKRFSVAMGPMLNIYVSDTYDTDYDGIYSQVPPYYFSNSTSVYGFNTKMWIGGKIALRFL